MGAGPNTLREPTVRELIEAGSITTAHAVGRSGGFAVMFRCGAVERCLASARGGVRLFSNLTTLGIYLQRLGISGFEVDMSNYQPGRLRPPRPDRAEALRKTRTRLRQADLLETIYR